MGIMQLLCNLIQVYDHYVIKILNIMTLCVASLVAIRSDLDLDFVIIICHLWLVFLQSRGDKPVE